MMDSSSNKILNSIDVFQFLYLDIFYCLFNKPLRSVIINNIFLSCCYPLWWYPFMFPLYAEFIITPCFLLFFILSYLTSVHPFPWFLIIFNGICSYVKFVCLFYQIIMNAVNLIFNFISLLIFILVF